VTDPSEDGGFTRGMVTGAAALIVVFQCLLAWWFSGYEAMYRELGPGAHISRLTILVIRGPWLFGAPVVGGALVAALYVKRPRPIGLYLGTVGLLIATAAFTAYFAYRPIFALAGNISGE